MLLTEHICLHLYMVCLPRVDNMQELLSLYGPEELLEVHSYKQEMAANITNERIDMIQADNGIN